MARSHMKFSGASDIAGRYLHVPLHEANVTLLLGSSRLAICARFV